jgi:hypothetical protein
VDTDYGAYSESAVFGAGGLEQPWREDRIDAVLDGYDDGVLFEPLLRAATAEIASARGCDG